MWIRITCTQKINTKIRAFLIQHTFMSISNHTYTKKIIRENTPDNYSRDKQMVQEKIYI